MFKFVLFFRCIFVVFLHLDIELCEYIVYCNMLFIFFYSSVCCNFQKVYMQTLVPYFLSINVCKCFSQDFSCYINHETIDLAHTKMPKNMTK